MSDENKFISAGGNAQELIRAYGTRVENLMAEWLRVSADFTELRKEFTGEGLEHFQALKAAAKAKLLDAEDGGNRLHELRVKNEMARNFLDILAPEQQAEAAE